MTAHAEIIPPSPAGGGVDTPSGDNRALYGYAGAPSQRWDGWSADRQRIFLQAVSEGCSVTHACRIVGLTKQSAYAFRSSAKGAGFALGWRAAALLARDALADELMERAMNGITETCTYRNGETAERHRHDNRLAMAMLTRMDRMADSARGGAGDAAVRLIAQEFDQYLDIVGRDGGPARAGLFLGARLGAEGATPADEDDLAPIRALARADRWLRTHTDLAAPLDTADLDPAARAGWTAEQWARAEAAGLLQLAAPAEPRDGNGQASQHIRDFDNPQGAPVWWCNRADAWRTHFPPPDDFYGDEDGDYGDEDYARSLTAEEEDAIEAPHLAEVEERRAVETVARDIWFGFVQAPEPPTVPPLEAPAPQAPEAAPSDPGTPAKPRRGG